MKIRKIDVWRLYAVLETPNEKGLYDLIPFVDNLSDFNEEFERYCLDETLDALVSRLYGGGFCIEVDETELETCGDFIRLQVGEHRVEVPDILDKINADPDDSKTYLLVDRALEDARWVIAERLTH